MKTSLLANTFFWDLGSINGRLYTPEGGLYADTQTVILRDKVTLEAALMGADAFALMEKVPPQLEFVNLINRGRIADPHLSLLIEKMAEGSLNGILQKIFQPMAVITTSPMDPVHFRGLKRSFVRSGFRGIIQIPQAAAICASRNEDFENDHLVLDLGAGKIEFTALSGGRKLFNSFLEQGGEDLDKKIRDFIEEKKHLAISLSDARQIKNGYSFSSKKKKPIYLLGKDLNKGVISTISIDPAEIDEPVGKFIKEVTDIAKVFITKLPASHLRSVKQEGFLLAGGLSLIEGLDLLISEELQFPVIRVARQHIAPLLGASKLYSQWDKYSYLGSDEFNNNF